MAVFVGDPREMSELFYERNSNSGLEYVRRSIETFAQAIPQAYNYLVDTARQQFDRMVEVNTGRVYDALQHKLNNLWGRDSIRFIGDIGDVQQANDSMVRWIMANPSLGQLYADERIVGYGDRYVPYEGNPIGVDNKDYRKVMDGVLFESEGNWQFTHYYDTPVDDDIVLSTLDKLSIANTWQLIEKSLAESDTDPTDEWNGLIE